MDKDEKLAQIMEKSRLMFLNEEREKLQHILITLLNYRLHRRADEINELERFFHSLKGTASTLQFEELSAIGEEFEDYINTIKKGSGLSERFFLKVLDGLAQVNERLEILFLQHSGTKEDDMIPDNDVDNDHIKETAIKSKKSILLVDDVSVIVHIMGTHLSSMNYDIASAKDGEEGVRKCKALRPDLMLVDLMLPKIDGFEVCRRIKNDPETKDTKIIVVSSENKKEAVLKCFEAGIDDYMVKPFSMQELEQRVKKLLGD